MVESRGGTGGKASAQRPDPGGNGRAGSGTVAYENGPEDGKRTAPGTVSEALENTVRTMAEIRAVSLEAMEELVFDNLVRGFLGELYCL